MKHIDLVQDKKECCGCGACVNVCFHKAISMQEDELGYMYPQINKELCVGCGLCQKVCAFTKKQNMDAPLQAFAAMADDKEVLRKSASGGVFGAIAMEVLKSGGKVFGCSMEYIEELSPEHIGIEHVSELNKLQGSKYVQSDMKFVYQQVKEAIKKGRTVLFSGTPCQVAALKSYLGNKHYENLLTMDLICHGVPSIKFFRSYVKELEKSLKGKVIDFKFRDKDSGWGLKGKVYYLDRKGNKKEKSIPSKLSSYYKLFLDSCSYRESCYNCKYANQYRVGDLTIGDYWGIQGVHADYLVQNGGILDEKKGISAILVNTDHGKRMLEKYGIKLNVLDSQVEDVIKSNDQLRHPSHMNKNRDYIMKLYCSQGYEAVERWYRKQMGMKRYIHIIWNGLPKTIQQLIRKIIY